MVPQSACPRPTFDKLANCVGEPHCRKCCPRGCHFHPRIDPQEASCTLRIAPQSKLLAFGRLSEHLLATMQRSSHLCHSDVLQVHRFSKSRLSTEQVFEIVSCYLGGRNHGSSRGQERFPSWQNSGTLESSHGTLGTGEFPKVLLKFMDIPVPKRSLNREFIKENQGR